MEAPRASTEGPGISGAPYTSTRRESTVALFGGGLAAVGQLLSYPLGLGSVQKEGPPNPRPST